MTDKVDEQDELEGEFDDEALEEEFDFDSEDLDLSEDPVENLSEAALEPQAAPSASKAVKKPGGGGSKAIAALLALGVVGFVGYKGYDLFLSNKEVNTAKQNTTPKANSDTAPITIASNPTPKPTLPSLDDMQNQPSSSSPAMPSSPSIGSEPKAAPPSIGNFPGVDDIANSLPDPKPTSDNWFEQQKNDIASNTASIPSTQSATYPSSGISKKDLNALEKKINEDKDAQNERMERIESDMQKLMKRMSDINNNIAGLQNSMSQMNDTLGQYSAEIAKVSKVQQQKQEKIQAQKTKQVQTQRKQQQSAPTMSVHAIIPGRAWLRSDDGQIITITEGDNVDRYGKVLRIDANEGVVVTSSGVALR